MILVDDRIGSADLVGHLRHWSVPCAMERLTFGDACFVGNGPNGPVSVGIEIKRIHDALTCMGDGRFAGHQLPGLVATYDRVWLVLEGLYRPDFTTGLLLADGQRRREITQGSRRFMYKDLCNWLTSMEIMAGLRVRRTGDRVETARVIADLFSWWSKQWGDHKSHVALHQNTPVAVFFKPTLARMVAAQLPGVGFTKSREVAARFHTVESMMEATLKEWTQVEGIGPVLAKRIYDAIRTR